MLEITARFMSDLQRAHSVGAVWEALAAMGLALGFDRAILAALPSRPGELDPRLGERRTSFPEAELDEYLEGGLVQADPLFRATVRSDRPVALHLDHLRRSLPRGEARGLLDLALVRDSPLRVTLPAVTVASGARWGFAVGGAIPERDVAGVLPEAAPALWLGSAAAALRLEALGGGEEVESPLTRRERECLLRLAQGDRADRIAEALGISNPTVELHLSNARRRLGARTSAEAVAKAVLKGWILP